MREVEVRDYHACPTLHIDGRPVTGLMHWKWNVEEVDAANFGRCGVQLFSFIGQLWLGPGPDPSQPVVYGDVQTPFPAMKPEVIDRTMRTLLAGNPDVLVLPRIRMVPPEWWKQANPGEMMVHYSLDKREFMRGTLAAVTSSRWLADATRALITTVEYFEEHWGERVIGYHTGFGLCAEHAYFWGNVISDYSTPQLRAFREWLRGKYGSVDALRLAWGQPTLDFATVEFPPPESVLGAATSMSPLMLGEGSRWRVDFQQFSAEAMADSVILQARTVKRTLARLGRRKVYSTFYGYMNLEANSGAHFAVGHNAQQRVLNSPDVDMICAPISYAARQPGGFSLGQVLPGSIGVHGKLYYGEDDTGTHLANSHHGFVASDVDSAIHNLRRNFLEIWRSGGTLWWMDLRGQGWFYDEALLAEITRLRQFADETLARRQSTAEIAVFASDRSEHAMRGYPLRFAGLFIEQQLHEIAAIGAPYDVFRIEDLPELVKQGRLQQYRFCVVLNAFMVDDALLRLMRERLCAEGRTVLWFYAPGMVHEDNCDVERVKALTGMDFALIRHGKASMLTETWLDGRRVVYGYSGNLFPRLTGKDPSADSLGYYVEGTGIVAPGTGDGAALMSKRLSDWRSIWSSSPGMPSALLAHFAAEAGVHLYGRRGDQFLAGPGWLGVHAKCGGELTISLPAPATLRDAISGDEIARNSRTCTVTTTRGETRLFLLE